jgi:F-type H+-transporting ATPase subunit a
MSTFTFIISPLEQFETVPMISLTIPVLTDIIFSVTNLGLYVIFTVIIIISLHYFSINSRRLIPNGWSIFFESSYSTIVSIVRGQIGNSYEIFLPFTFSLFWFVLVCNFHGNIPYSYTVTSSAITTMGLSIIIFIGVTSLAIRLHGYHALSFFVPSGTPLALVPILVLIETISYFARSVSLGIRLFSNITAGHTLLKILSTFLGQLFTSGIVISFLTLFPFLIFVALIVLEIAVSLIQAYVLTVLTSSYLKDSLELH